MRLANMDALLGSKCAEDCQAGLTTSIGCLTGKGYPDNCQEENLLKNLYDAKMILTTMLDS